MLISLKFGSQICSNFKHFSFAEKILPPDRCGTSIWWQISVIIHADPCPMGDMSEWVSSHAGTVFKFQELCKDLCNIRPCMIMLTVCAEILWLCKPTVASAVQAAGLRRSCRWCKIVCQHRRRLMAANEYSIHERQLWWTFLHQHADCTLPQNFVLWDKSAYVRVALYCDQPKAHLCINHAG